MPDVGTVSIARIPLARARMRLLLAPLVLLVAGAVAAGGGVLLGGLPGVGLVVAGIVVSVLAIYLALIPLTARLDVEVATLRLRWLGGERAFTLVRGAVTRVPLVGEGAARLRPRFGALGWALGPARLRGDESIQLVRLAPTPSMILVPTDQGRFGIAAASETQLLDALGAAARVQQRLDEVAARTRAFMPAVVSPPPPEIVEPVEPPAETGPRVMTGIERAILEERLAAQRAAALARAEAERAAAAAAPPVQETEPAEEVVVRERRRGVTLPRPSLPRVSRPALPRPSLTPGALGPYAVAVLPVVAAGGLWVYAWVIGRFDLPVEQLRPLDLALALGGPGGSIAALMARTWFPRLLGVVTVTALCALILVGRALVS